MEEGGKGTEDKYLWWRGGFRRKACQEISPINNADVSRCLLI